MKIKTLNVIILISLITASSGLAVAENPAQSHDLTLNPELRELLQAEMREITAGIQGVALALATADWNSIQKTGTMIRTSYIMESQLTPAQAKELEQALPERFKQMDEDFHHRAEKMATAAAAHDPEAVAFHYSRMLESCAQCHSEFATEKFPGFAPKTPQHHH
jgi:cytochrome c556